MPASMGLSVYLPAAPASGTDAIEVELSYADHDSIDIAEDTEDTKKARLEGVPHGPMRFSVPLDPKLLASGVSLPGRSAWS